MGADGGVGRDLETAGESDEARRKKTVNEAFLEAHRDYPPQREEKKKKNLWPLFFFFFFQN